MPRLLVLALVLASGAPLALAQDFTLAQPTDCAYAACGDGGPCYLDPAEVSAPEAFAMLSRPESRYRIQDLADRVAASGDEDFVGPLLALADAQAGAAGDMDELIRRQDLAFYVLRAASGLSLDREAFVSRALALDRPAVAAAAIRTLALDPTEAELDSLSSTSGDSTLADGPDASLTASALTHYRASLLARQRYESLGSTRGRLDFLLWGPREGWRSHAFRALHASDPRRVDIAIISYQSGTAGRGGPPAPSRPLACEQTEIEAYAQARVALHLLLDAPPALVPPFQRQETSGVGG